MRENVNASTASFASPGTVSVSLYGRLDAVCRREGNRWNCGWLGKEVARNSRSPLLGLFRFRYAGETESVV